PIYHMDMPFFVKATQVKEIITDDSPIVSVQLNEDDSTFTLNSNKGEEVYNLNTKIPLEFCNITVIPNAFYIDKEDSKFDNYEITINERATIIDNLIKNIRPTITENSSVITISLESTSRKISEDILNTLVAFYNENAIKNKNIISLNTARFIDKRLQIISQELDSVETNKVDFK